MASKTLFVITVFLAAMAAAPLTQAQLLGLGQLRINGTVHCSTGTVTSTTPVFPNAAVQLQCGSSVVSSATTKSNGAFSMSLNFITSLLSTLLNGCKLVVTTPLSTCNASLPTDGILESGLQLLSGGGLIGALVDTILGPLGFSIVQ